MAFLYFLQEAQMKEREILIAGMSCHHCVMAVRKELERLSAVQVRDVKIGSAFISFDETKITGDQINAAIEKAGYKPVN
jgi:copper chaperone